MRNARPVPPYKPRTGTLTFESIRRRRRCCSRRDRRAKPMMCGQTASAERNCRRPSKTRRSRTSFRAGGQRRGVVRDGDDLTLDVVGLEAANRRGRGGLRHRVLVLVSTFPVEEIRLNGDEAIGRQLVGDALHPLRLSIDLVNHDDHRRLARPLRVHHARFDAVGRSNFDHHPFGVPWRFRQALGDGRRPSRNRHVLHDVHHVARRGHRHVGHVVHGGSGMCARSPILGDVDAAHRAGAEDTER